MSEPLARALLAHLPEARADAVTVDEVEAVLQAAVAEQSASTPGLTVDPEAFGAVLADKLGPDGSILEALGRMRVADLALAWACTQADPRALAFFEPILVREVELAAARISAPAAVVDEAKQVVRTILLLPQPDRAPAIAGYAGRGELRAWVRVVAIRELVRIQKASRRDAAFEDDALYDLLAPQDEPEVEHLKALYQRDFVAAFRDAIEALTSKERLLLRQQCLDGLTIDDLGALHGVHRATAARWLAKTRDTLLSSTRKGLMKRLGIPRADVDSILQLLQSRLDLSLDSALATRSSLEPPPAK